MAASGASSPTAPTRVHGIPREPIAIGHEPQFVFDLYVVDNHWGVKISSETVKRVFHPPKKHPANPLPGVDRDLSWPWILRDPQSGLFRMWYQANYKKSDEQRNREIKEKWAKEDAERIAAGLEPLPARGRRQGVGRYVTAIAYAESKDGVHWEKPALGLVDSPFGAPNVLLSRAHAPQLLEGVPERDLRGYKYLLLYYTNGIHLAGSHDGIHWDWKNGMRVAHLASDHPNVIVYDPQLAEYVMFCRSKHLYNVSNDPSPSRRVSRMSSPELWTDWMKKMEPQTIVDEIDPTDRGFNFSMGMPVRYYAGVYWGMHEPFRYNDYVWTELMVSRDGVHFQKMPGRQKLVEFGTEGSWDDTIIMGCASWVEVGDEWWFYYNGWDNEHGNSPTGTMERVGHLGLATVRKEGLISMRGPQGGGMIVTRKLLWPGGPLMVNADASQGELRVAVSDERRLPLAGYGLEDCLPISGDGVAQRISWKGKSLEDFKGRVIRLEFMLRDADLFTFRADNGVPTRSPGNSVALEAPVR